MSRKATAFALLLAAALFAAIGLVDPLALSPFLAILIPLLVGIYPGEKVLDRLAVFFAKAPSPLSRGLQTVPDRHLPSRHPRLALGTRSSRGPPLPAAP